MAAVAHPVGVDLPAEPGREAVPERDRPDRLADQDREVRGSHRVGRARLTPRTAQGELRWIWSTSTPCAASAPNSRRTYSERSTRAPSLRRAAARRPPIVLEADRRPGPCPAARSADRPAICRWQAVYGRPDCSKRSTGAMPSRAGRGSTVSRSMSGISRRTPSGPPMRGPPVTESSTRYTSKTGDMPTPCAANWGSRVDGTSLDAGETRDIHLGQRDSPDPFRDQPGGLDPGAAASRACSCCLARSPCSTGSIPPAAQCDDCRDHVRVRGALSSR